MADHTPSITSVDQPTSLPPGCALIPAEQLDLRSDEEITAHILTRRPITSEKNVWAFWHSGFSQMPAWVRRNVINWVRRLGPSWSVHVLDCVPGSETNVLRYIEADQLPQAVVEGTMDGPFARTHQGDAVRLPLLYRYGGVWMDVGTLLLRSLESLCWDKICDESNPYGLCGFVLDLNEHDTTMLNGFIATRAGNPFVKRWHDIYLELWRWNGGQTNALGFHAHPLLTHMPAMFPAMERLKCPDLKVPVEIAGDYLAHFSCFERLRCLVDPSDGFDGADYYANKMLFFHAAEEMFPLQVQTAWDGQRQHDLFTAQREGPASDPSSQLWRDAEDTINGALAGSSTMKLPHGPAGKVIMFLADFWDEEEFADADVPEGTFAHRLRYGSVHFEQTRELVPLRVSRNEVVHRLGVLEVKEVAQPAEGRK